MYEIHGLHDSYVVACSHCVTICLQRAPYAASYPEPAAGPCELNYDGCQNRPISREENYAAYLDFLASRDEYGTGLGQIDGTEGV
jgi:hypothetical protein